MKQPLLTILTMVILVMLSISGKAKEVYQINSATDWKTLLKLQGGDKVLVAPGKMPDVQVKIKVKNTSEEKPVHIVAKEPGKTVFTGITRIILDGNWINMSGFKFTDGGAGHKEGVVKFENRSANCRLTNCSFKDFNQGKKDCSWVFLRGYNHRVDHCSFEGKTSKNATLFIKANHNSKTEKGPKEKRNHRIDHNYFGPRKNIGSNGYECLRIGDSNTQGFNMSCVIENNYFYQTIKAENASEMEVISNKSCGNIYRNNIFEDCDGQLTLRHGQKCLVEGNLFLGTGGKRQSGVRVIGIDHIVRNNFFYNLGGEKLRSALCIMDGKYGDNISNKYEGVENAIIEKNTFLNCTQPINIGECKGPADPPKNITFKDNSIYSNQGKEIFTIEKDVQLTESTGNKAFHAQGKYGNTPPDTKTEKFTIIVDPTKKPFLPQDVKPSFEQTLKTAQKQ